MTQEKICKILELGFGGVGVAKEEGKVIFVPFAAPGDLAKIKIEKDKHRFSFGKISALISPSNLRIEPPCPYFGECGGCQLQHLPVDYQRQFKQKIVHEAFHKYAHLKAQFPLAELKETDPEYRYRDHITLHFHNDLLGFYSYEERPHLLAIDDCLLFKKNISSLTPLLHASLKKLSIQSAHIKVISTEKGMIVAIRPKRPWKLKKTDSQMLLDLQKEGSLYSIGIMDPEGEQFETSPFAIEFAIGKAQITISPWSFLQNQSDLAIRAYQTMEQYLLEADAKNILDLFSGSGIQTLILASTFKHLTAIENNPFAVKSALQNAQQNQIKNVTFLEGDVKDFDRLVQLNSAKENKIDAVILNPPKGGCEKELLEKLSAHKIKHIIYMSCFPSTLARDCKVLHELGYTLKDGKIFDFFPQTTHVETIVSLHL